MSVLCTYDASHNAVYVFFCPDLKEFVVIEKLFQKNDLICEYEYIHIL